MASTSASITTGWVPPDAITGLSCSNVDELSRIELDWDTSGLADVDFEYYRVERRPQETSSWTTLIYITTKTTSQYLDATAGQGIAYEYRVRQYKHIAGDAPLASPEGDIVTGMLELDDWFVIGNENPADEPHCFSLPVVEETHTRPIQQEVFEPIVKNRKKVARGNVLGFEGSLRLQWASDERTTAKTRLDFLAAYFGPHLLKSPFGDVWRVEFDAPDYKYLAVGHLNVEIGWVEVV